MVHCDALRARGLVTVWNVCSRWWSRYFLLLNLVTAYINMRAHDLAMGNVFLMILMITLLNRLSCRHAIYGFDIGLLNGDGAVISNHLSLSLKSTTGEFSAIIIKRSIVLSTLNRTLTVLIFPCVQDSA